MRKQLADGDFTCARQVGQVPRKTVVERKPVLPNQNRITPVAGSALAASLFRGDPRYFRRGPASSALNRVGYALSRIVITRRDSGRDSFNFSGIAGTGMGIALSDAYYPRPSVGGGELEWRIVTSLGASALGNLLPEFWPDIKQKPARGHD